MCLEDAVLSRFVKSGEGMCYVSLYDYILFYI